MQEFPVAARRDPTQRVPPRRRAVGCCGARGIRFGCQLRGTIGVVELRTARLTLRRWKEEDREPFAALNADAVVMEHLPSTLTRAESDAFVARIEQHFDEHDFGLWAVEVTATQQFIGYVGLWKATFEAHFTPAVEIGWRLAQHAWGRGFATEAARAALRDGFDRLRLDEIVSFTATSNVRSQRVMHKLGMTHDPADDFDHPNVAPTSPLRRHVLYRARPDAAHRRVAAARNDPPSPPSPTGATPNLRRRRSSPPDPSDEGHAGPTSSPRMSPSIPPGRDARMSAAHPRRRAGPDSRFLPVLRRTVLTVDEAAPVVGFVVLPRADGRPPARAVRGSSR